MYTMRSKRTLLIALNLIALLIMPAFPLARAQNDELSQKGDTINNIYLPMILDAGATDTTVLQVSLNPTPVGMPDEVQASMVAEPEETVAIEEDTQEAQLSLDESAIFLPIIIGGDTPLSNEFQDNVEDTVDAAAGTVKVTAVRTADLSGQPKRTFNSGESIRYYATVRNTTGRTATAYFTWTRSGPCGSITLWAGNLDTGNGIGGWQLDSTVPTDCPGAYTYTMLVKYQNVSSSQSRAFTVKAGGSVTATSAWTGDLSGNTKTIFAPGDNIRYYANVRNTTAGTATAYFTWARRGPCGTVNLWTGNLQTGTGTWTWQLDGNVPSDCPGTYTYTFTVNYNNATSSKSSIFNLYSTDTARTELRHYIEDVKNATAVRYDAKDSDNRSMDTLKIIADPSGGYLGVYHTSINSVNQVRVATSSDLLNWTFRKELAYSASQPAIKAVGNSFVVAWEHESISAGNNLQFAYYTDRSALLAGNSAKFYNANRKINGACNEGTPNIYNASSTFVEFGFHYMQNCDVDRQARGTITWSGDWNAAAQPKFDNAILHWGVRGNIGDRDGYLNYKGYNYGLIEGQRYKGDWGSWKVYLYDYQTGNADPLEIHVTDNRNLVSVANPTFTNLIAPNGRSAIVVTLYVHSPGAAPGEAGQLIYYRTYE